MNYQNDSPYIDQYNRMKRWYQRIKNPGSESNFLDDIGDAFFMCCFHLKDWVKNDESLDSKKREKVEEFVKKSPFLKVCFSICNQSKHLVCKDPQVIGELRVKKICALHNLNGPGATYSTVKGFIEIGDDAYEIGSFAEFCIKEWDRYFEENSIPIPIESKSVSFDLSLKLKEKFGENS